MNRRQISEAANYLKAIFKCNVLTVLKPDRLSGPEGYEKRNSARVAPPPPPPHQGAAVGSHLLPPRPLVVVSRVHLERATACRGAVRLFHLTLACLAYVRLLKIRST